MGTTITVRPTEQAQLTELLQDVHERLIEADSDADAETIATIQSELDDLSGNVSGFIEADEDSWRTVVDGLNSLDGSRSGWVASKIARRARLDPMRMGFSTFYPVGFLMTESIPE